MSWVYCVRPVPNAPGYFVDRTGNVYSQRLRHYGRLGNRLRTLKQIVTKGKGRLPYLRVSFSVNGRYRKRSVHGLILEAFGKKHESGQCCRHLDGNPQNNRLENLAWGTYQENSDDMKRHGTVYCGTACHTAKLTPDDVVKIRKDTRTHQAIADDYGVDPATIGSLLAGKSWKSVP